MYNNISISDRVFRMAVCYGLIFFVVSGSGPIGALAYLPLISIYLGITSLIGWDPLSAVVSKVERKSDRQTRNTRGGNWVTQ